MKKNKTGKKEFGLQNDGQDFRIMAAAIVRSQENFFVVLGSSSGQLILEKVLIENGRVSMRQVNFIQHQAALLCLKRIGTIVAAGFTDGSVRLYKVKADGISVCHVSERVHGFGVNAIDAFVTQD